MKYSIIIPARNEAANIGLEIDSIQRAMRREGIDYEIIVVDDGSTDNTASVIAEICVNDPQVRCIPNQGRHGYGYAVRCGLEHFSGDAVSIVMADASDATEDIVSYFYILRDKAECAFGSRWIRGSQVIDYPVGKLVLNRLANTFIKVLFGIRYNDTTNAFKGFRRSVIDGCRPFFSPHFNFTVELPLKAIVRGYTYAVTPIKWTNRKYGQSSLHIEEMGSRYLYTILNIWLEKMLTRDDFHRPPDEHFMPFPAPENMEPADFKLKLRSP